MRMRFFHTSMNSFLVLTISLLCYFNLTSTFTIAQVVLQPEYRFHICSNKTTFAPNSNYQFNLKSLLANLSDQAAAGNYFYQIPVDAEVYGSYLCNENVDTDVCRDCVATAAKEATELCPIEKNTVIWFDFCMLRYANRSFFYTMETSPAVKMWNSINASDQSALVKALAEITRDFATQAENGAKRFLTKEIQVPGLGIVYSLMQCTPDLSASDCTKCLNFSIQTVPVFFSGRKGGQVLTPSCNIRFDLINFYGRKDPVLLPPSPPPTITSPSLPAPPGKKARISGAAIAAIVTLPIIVASVALGCFVLRYRRLKKMRHSDVVRQENGTDSLQYELITIETATKNFSQDYKLGEGGFGEVYKGIFSSGQEIAVKRLSKSSGQGTEEFKNEVALVAKLQHRNLVRLLGFSWQEERHYSSTNPEKRGLLDWSIRSKIIGGICRGILYLHEDSRLRVIHRDLKASNVLLDGDMNPKISDFGMARMVGVDQTQGNTKRIVGTYGYMAPQYAMEGLYSVKSDVYSFGVLLLEILCGKKNSGFHVTNSASSLLAIAWQLWNEGRGLELMDEVLREKLCPPNEFLRYIHIGLLCVQEDAYNRPTMSTVLLMLTSETTSLPKPERPAFFMGRHFSNKNHQVLDIAEGCSDNGLTISHFSPR